MVNFVLALVSRQFIECPVNSFLILSRPWMINNERKISCRGLPRGSTLAEICAKNEVTLQLKARARRLTLKPLADTKLKSAHARRPNWLERSERSDSIFRIYRNSDYTLLY
jgi:hypothetical protein